MNTVGKVVLRNSFLLFAYNKLNESIYEEF